MDGLSQLRERPGSILRLLRALRRMDKPAMIGHRGRELLSKRPFGI